VWLCTVIVAGSGCATIVNGRTQAVTVSSEPPGAHIYMGGQLLGVTPARLELKRRDEHIVLRFEKNGFVGQEIPVKRSVSGWIAGNAVALNPFQCQGYDSVGACGLAMPVNVSLGLAIDFITGAAFKHPGIVRVILTPKGVGDERARHVGVGAELARPVRQGMNTPEGAADAGRPLPTGGSCSPPVVITVTPADCSVVCCARSKLTSAF
jgi:hypothetical protein